MNCTSCDPMAQCDGQHLYVRSALAQLLTTSKKLDEDWIPLLQKIVDWSTPEELATPLLLDLLKEAQKTPHRLAKKLLHTMVLETDGGLAHCGLCAHRDERQRELLAEIKALTDEELDDLDK